MSTFKPLDGMRKKINSTTGAYESVVDQNGDVAFPAAAFSSAEVAAGQALVSGGGVSSASSEMTMFGWSVHGSFATNTGSPYAGFRRTTRRIRTAKRKVTRMSVVVDGGPGLATTALLTSGGETAIGAGFVCSAHIEYPLGAIWPVTFKGRRQSAVRGGVALLESDPTYLHIPEGATWGWEFFKRHLTPLTLTAAVASGGSLTTDVVHRFIATTGCADLEGPMPAAAVTATPTGATLAVKLDWSGQDRDDEWVYIYAASASISGGANGIPSGAQAGAGNGIGATTITNLAAGTGSVVAGTYVQFGTDPRQYQVTGPKTSVATAGSFTIGAPGLNAAVTSGTAMTFTNKLVRVAKVPAYLGTYTINAVVTSSNTAGGEGPTLEAYQGARANYCGLTDSREFCNSSNTYDGVDYTGTAQFPPSFGTGPSLQTGDMVMVVADNPANKTTGGIYVIGDSIENGVGTGNGWTIYTQGMGGSLARALFNRDAESWGVHAIGGTRLNQLVNGSGSSGLRLGKLRYARVVYNQLGYNDITTRTWQQMALDVLDLSRMLPAGVKLRQCTISAKTDSTDLWLTTASQTFDGFKASTKDPFNLWVRSGCQFANDGVTPVTSGGTTPSTIDGVNFLDLAAATEVNSSNALTPYAGLHMAPTAALATGVVTSATGTNLGAFAITGTLTGGGAFPVPNNTTPAYARCVLKMTSGSQSGKISIIDVNTATVLTTLSVLTLPVDTTTLTFVDTAALQAAFPAASNTTKTALVGTAPDLRCYNVVSNTWTLVVPGANSGTFQSNQNTHLDCRNPILQAPGNGDTFEIWQTTSTDGGHPTAYGHGLRAAVATAHLAALYG